MADPWASFPRADAPAVDPWAAFPKANEQKAKTAPKVEPAVLPTGEVIGAVDGDTAALSSGQHLRILGVDAPESRQQGWDKAGQPFPIGKQSTSALAQIASSNGLEIGEPAGQSYGRPVAPLSGQFGDVGQYLARQGNALAAPDYLKADPERRFQYMQAERLARQNGLGVHKYRLQVPEEFRRAPIATPERLAVPRFWDTPTPFSGMREDAEKRVVEMINDRSIKPEAVAEFAKLNGGFVIDPATVTKARASSDKDGQAIRINYQDGPKVLTDQGDGAGGALSRGIANGVLPNFLEEAGAVVDTLGGTDGRENVWNSDRRLADIWANNQYQNDAITGFDAYAHPYAKLTGEVTGGLAVPIGRVSSVADLAKFGAGYGFVAGAGVPGSIPERLTSGVVGAGEGLALTVAGGKALEGAARLGARAFKRLRPESAAEAAADLAAAREAWPETLRSMRDSGGAVEVAPGAVYHPEVGSIDMRWGKPGDPARDFAGGYGLSHIIAKHEHENILPDLPDRIAAMTIKEVDPRHSDRLVLEGETGRAVIARTWHGEDQQWVLTAYDPKWKPPSSETSPPSLIDGAPGSALHGGEADIASLANSRNAVPMGSEAGPALQASNSAPGPLSAPHSDARLKAAAETVEPRDVLPIASNEVGSAEEAAAAQAGRYAEAKAPNERGELSRGTVRAWNGARVPKVGPVDLIGWTRLQGGLVDQGGELLHMGLTNAARRGQEFVGQETRFGPLVSPDGMNLDDAAMRAWEAGYFPGHAERPTVNEFLDAVRGTHEGWNRHFLADDLPEIERFKAMRDERFALEQQQREGPVFVDRSVPASEGAPFPPAQAYEEWPAGGPDFAGNINLGKLDSPQDIARALDTTERRVGGFDAATRGRVAHAETERLASELGMTPETLLARRKGQAFNAEEALAARQILAKSGNELVNAAKKLRGLENPGDELLADFRQKWLRHVAIQEQVSGATAEAGRALSQFRMAADSRAVRGDVLSAMTLGGGGPHRLTEAADILLDAVEAGPGVFNTVAQKAAQPKWRDKIAEWYVNALLGWPQTHVVNVTSNTLTSLAQIPEYAAGALIGAGRQALSREAVDRVTASEVGARAFGLLQGAKEGARMFAQALRTGEAADFASKVEGQQFRAISGMKGEVIRLPTRFLTAEDELFKGVARRMELNGQAVRIARKEGLTGEEAKRRIAELVADPTDEMFQRALDYGRYLTFQQKLGPTAQSISTFASSNLPAKFLLPFIRTPTNLLKFAVERSPAAPLLKEWRADFLAGGERRDMAIARSLLGTGFGLAMFEAAAAGNLTGSTPADPRKAKLLMADGWKPYSIKIDGNYYSYKRLDPFSTTLGVAADLATLPSGMSDKQREDKTTLLIASIMGNLANKTWLSGASSFIEALSEPERYAGDFKNRLVASFLVPNAVGGIARTVDPVTRKPETLTEELQSRIPGLRDDLLPRRDVWGRELRSTGGVGPDAFSPIWISQALNDPVNHELMQIDYAPGTPSKKVGGQELTPEQYDRYLALAGQTSHETLGRIVASADWRAMDDAAKVKVARKAVSDARKTARASLGLSGGSVDDADSNGVSADPWGAFPKASANPDPWAAFPKPDNPDIVGDLRRALPGLGVSSGYRTPAYQAEMRRRGYKPADNSAHLDGSALDLTPPPGKSYGWLRAEVQRRYPKARFLMEGDHLHTTFPGWYGAPVLGGAKLAGLVNPNGGR